VKWVLTPDEFSYVWANETCLERRPYPVNLAPSASVHTTNEYDALQLPQRFARQADPDLAAALMLCAHNDATTITVAGHRTYEPDTPDQPRDEPIMAFAAALRHHAALLHTTESGVTTVRMCHTRTLGNRLVRLIGSAREGQIGPLRQPREAVLTTEPPTPENGAPGQRDAARLRRTLRRPVEGRGFITVTVKPDHPMSPPTRHRSWLDIRGDGRYLLASGDELVLAPVDDDTFAAELHRLAHIR